jgi:hypothetical protein
MRKLVHSEQRVSDALGQSTSTAQQHCMRTSMSPSAVLYVLVMQFTRNIHEQTATAANADK